MALPKHGSFSHSVLRKRHVGKLLFQKRHLQKKDAIRRAAINFQETTQKSYSQNAWSDNPTPLKIIEDP